MKKKENDPLLYKVGKLIKQYREEQNLTQTQLSDLSGVEQSYISKLELGKKPGYTFGIVAKLFTALKIKFSEIDDL